MNEEVSRVVFLVMIAGRKQKDNLLAALSESGGKLINTIYGRGSVKATYLRDMFGLVAEENKAVISCLISSDKSEAVLKMLIEKFNFDKPNTGIAFTIPVDSLSY